MRGKRRVALNNSAHTGVFAPYTGGRFLSHFIIKVLSVIYFIFVYGGNAYMMDTVINYFALKLCFFLISNTVSRISDLKLFDCLVYFISVTA